MTEATAFWGILGWPFCRYVDRASPIHISHKHGPLRWTVNHACKTVPLHFHCRKKETVRASRAGRRKSWRIPLRSPCGNKELSALPVREDKTAAWQMHTTLCEHVMQALSVAMYRRLHTHTRAHTMAREIFSLHSESPRASRGCHLKAVRLQAQQHVNWQKVPWHGISKPCYGVRLLFLFLVIEVVLESVAVDVTFAAASCRC